MPVIILKDLLVAILATLSDEELDRVGAWLDDWLQRLDAPLWARLIGGAFIDALFGLARKAGAEKADEATPGLRRLAEMVLRAADGE